jgi:hypothetical protein
MPSDTKIRLKKQIHDPCASAARPHGYNLIYNNIPDQLSSPGKRMTPASLGFANGAEEGRQGKRVYNHPADNLGAQFELAAEAKRPRRAATSRCKGSGDIIAHSSAAPPAGRMNERAHRGGYSGGNVITGEGMPADRPQCRAMGGARTTMAPWATD